MLYANELTLAEAEQIALDLDFITKEFNARSESLNERAIADGQLPDPKLKLGILNIPVSSIRLFLEQKPEGVIGLVVPGMEIGAIYAP
jgi:hypothetical protein